MVEPEPCRDRTPFSLTSLRSRYTLHTPRNQSLESHPIIKGVEFIRIIYFPIIKYSNFSDPYLDRSLYDLNTYTHTPPSQYTTVVLRQGKGSGTRG